MKKQLLLAALILGAASANAQIEKITVDGSTAGLGAEATAVTAGTVLGSSDNVTVKAAYDDSYKVVSCAYLGYNNVIVNGESFSFGDGVQAVESVDAPTYNIGGRAAKSGLLIQKGKKYVK